MARKKKNKDEDAAQVAAPKVEVVPRPTRITTNEHPGPVYLEEPPRRAEVGPRHDGRGGTVTGPNIEPSADARFVMKHATADEMRAFKAQLEARLNAKDTPKLRLPDGTLLPGNAVLSGCPGCGRWDWVDPRHIGKACIFCNYSRRAGHPGVIRRATEKETAAWLERETARLKAQADGAEQRRKDREEFHKRMMQDGKI